MKLSSKPFSLIVLQPTSFCNINCEYCYLEIGERTTKGIMPLYILDTIFMKIFSSDIKNKSEHTRVSWHSGEPLIAPKDFYKAANQIISTHKPDNVKVTQEIITNGILIDEGWCKIFKECDINVVVSIDGPQFLHNANRKYRNGKGTFNEVVTGIRLLQQHKVPHRILTTITDLSLGHSKELFNFYKELKVENIGLNYEEVSAYNESSSIDENKLDKVKSFMNELYQLSEKDDSLQIREFEVMKNYLQFGDLYEFEYDTITPLSNISFDRDGNYSTFAAELLGMKHSKYENFIFGNILENEFKEIFENLKFNEIYSEIMDGVQSCHQSCDYFDICGSAKPDAKLTANNSLPSEGRFNTTESLYCIINTKTLAEVVMSNMKETLI